LAVAEQQPADGRILRFRRNLNAMCASPLSREAADLRPLRVLIAEDDANDLELCLRGLRKSGLIFEATAASTRDEFVRKLGEARFDVVISDYRMKGWTGMDALAAARKIAPETPVILLTGTLGDELAVECLKLGVTDYILKENMTRLPSALRRAREESEMRAAEMQAMAALRESEARYRGLVNNATYGIYWVTGDGGLLFVNPALVRMLGYESEQDLLGVRNSHLFYADPEVRDRVHGEYGRNGRVDAVVEWRRKDGKIISVRLNGRTVTEPSRKDPCVEVIVEDVTERLQLEKQLVQAQKFEAIGQLAGGIAHDFNNMIGAIIGWADLGIEETDSGSRIRRHFEKVRQQADRAAALTKQLLAFARRQILEPRTIDLNQVAVETLGLLENVIGSNIEIKASLAPDLAVVRADPVQIEQVLMNLCINARDAMPEGGSLMVETGNATLDRDFCAFQPHAHPGAYAVLSVADTGTGMDRATLDRIFEPFFTTKELGKGTGLGLATVYGIVTQHGGFLQVHSEVGRGTTFRAYFPVSTEAPKVETVRDRSPMRRGSETILIAEDHEALRQVAHETLVSLGYEVILAIDGEEAVRKFAANNGQIDLALLDVMLPKLSGTEVFARIREENPDLPVILSTGYSPDIALLDQVRQRGLPILQKPYSPHELARRVREALDRRRELVLPLARNIKSSAD
jgi:two-component system cell cycle sensor histidine kinase/response regulator CckA